jgi:hypothetical protein
MTAAAGNYKFVPIDDAITEAKQMLNIGDGTSFDIYINTLAQRALGRLNSLGQMFVENKRLTIDQGQAELPENCVRVIAMRYCDQYGKSYGAYLADFAFLDQCHLAVTGEDNRHFSGNVMINNNTIIWQYPVDAPIAVNVAYQAKKVDEDGFVLIYDYMVEAVMWYICWNFYLRYPKQYVPDQGAIWKREWKAQHDRVISYDAFNSFQNNFAKAVSLSHPRVLSL